LKVLLVCLGNICRSPTAHAVLRAKTRGLGWQIDSAGTGGWHIGYPPDRRATAMAEARGYKMGDLRARRVEPDGFVRFDLVLAMDRNNLRDLNGMAGADKAGIDLFLDHTLGRHDDVPDPYYSGDFHGVFELIETGVDALVRRYS
jgi:protein-tyrosine phosphatase